MIILIFLLLFAYLHVSAVSCYVLSFDRKFSSAVKKAFSRGIGKFYFFILPYTLLILAVLLFFIAIKFIQLKTGMTDMNIRLFSFGFILLFVSYYRFYLGRIISSFSLAEVAEK